MDVNTTCGDLQEQQSNERPEKPIALIVQPANIPSELCEQAQWVCWAYEWRQEREQWTKVPKNPKTGHNASPTDPRDWGSFTDALSRHTSELADGIGFVVTRDDPFVGIDLDKCRNPLTGVIDPNIRKQLSRFDSYAEVSPSGTGVRSWIQGSVFKTLGKYGPRKGRVEVYEALHFLTVTGQHLAGTPVTIEPRQEVLDAFLKECGFYDDAERTHARARLESSPPLTDDDILRLVRRAKNHERFERLWSGDCSNYGDDHSSADLALLCLLAFYTQDEEQLDRLFRQSRLYRGDKWERNDYRENTITKALDFIEEVYQPQGKGRGASGQDSTGAESHQQDTDQEPRSHARRLVSRRLSDIQRKDPEWLWPKWLALGKFHLLGGYAGDGKSTITANLAAIGSVGGRWPDHLQSPTFRTLFVLGEDAPDDTLLPRVALHGGNLRLISVLDGIHEGDGKERYFNVEQHLDLLERYVVDEHIGLIVIDPLTTIMVGTNRNAEGDVRDSLTGLTKMAERRNVAIIGIAHVGKPNGTARTAVQRLLGATAFVAISRVVWQTAPMEGEQRALGVTKNNLAVLPPTCVWSRAEDAPIKWEGITKQSIDELMGSPAKSRPRDAASDFLKVFLSSGLQPVNEVLAKAEERGLSETTIRRAAAELKVMKKQLPPGKGPWFWRLSEANTSHDSWSEPAA